MNRNKKLLAGIQPVCRDTAMLCPYCTLVIRETLYFINCNKPMLSYLNLPEIFYLGVYQPLTGECEADFDFTEYRSRIWELKNCDKPYSCHFYLVIQQALYICYYASLERQALENLYYFSSLLI